MLNNHLVSFCSADDMKCSTVVVTEVRHWTAHTAAGHHYTLPVSLFD